MAVPVVEFRDLSYSYGDRPILANLNLILNRGDVLALVGQSGAGKSTLLKLTNRMLLPASGAVLVEGRDTRAWNPIELRRRAGYVLQEIALFPHLTIEENVSLVPRLARWPRDQRQARTIELLELVGLPHAEFGKRLPRELSGGQRQRVGVARALAVRPPVLLMDEPFGALDPATRAELQGEFRRIQRELGQTVLLVTHDPEEARLLANRVAVLEGGRLLDRRSLGEGGLGHHSLGEGGP